MERYYIPASPIFDLDDPEGVIMEPRAHVGLENPLDIAALVEDVSRLIPSLQYICLSTSFGFLDVPVWEVRRDVEDQPGARRVLRLSRADGKRILKESILHRPAPEVEL
ncbi:hypothetical protein PHLGIDRAFT_181577 [Phlebiopsis gigantea 11061_1 CR5-6]|uniref:Uncharacterized protein n=1 Tax=Phlebiopsis gigantea (strain 11061_1 CR5-6) TaxID=745531 RepID=A0A0C3PG78_PHLG1|nr:hypothetical protein PHLGIDRAFT_181577 [Phlebiopsis gigantea 11061_1 CR5-6]